MFFLDDPYTIKMDNGRYLNVGEKQSRVLNKLGQHLYWVSNLELKRELEAKGILPLKENLLFEPMYKNALVRIANS